LSYTSGVKARGDLSGEMAEREAEKLASIDVQNSLIFLLITITFCLSVSSTAHSNPAKSSFKSWVDLWVRKGGGDFGTQNKSTVRVKDPISQKARLGYYADGAGLCLQITGSDAALADQWESTLASYVSPVLDPSPSLPLIPDS
jgi:hypothetical protein